MTAQFSDAGGVAQQPRFCTSELPLHAFSATPPASEYPLSTSPTGSPSLCSGITRGYAWCASSGGGSVWMREQRWESESQVRVSARPYAIYGDGVRRCSEWRVSTRPYTVCGNRVRRCSEWRVSTRPYTICGNGGRCAVSGEYLQDYIRYVGTAVSESIYKTIYDSRGWR